MPEHWDGQERRGNMPEIAALQESLEQVRVQLREQNQRTATQTAAMVEQTRKLTEVEEKLPSFVPKRRFRWVIGIVVLAVAAAVTLVLVFRVRDGDEAERRRAQLVHDAEQDRQSLVRGCERANEHRAALRRVIERAYAPTPIPDGIAPELRDLIVQSQERLVLLRAEQLADSGVQHIDCEAQYPATARTKT